MVRIYLNHELIATHQRNYAKGRYSTQKEHLCSTHQYYLDRSPEYYKNKAKKLSVTLGKLFELIFLQNKYPEQLYRSCDGLFSLCRNTAPDTFEKACTMAIDCKNYNYSFILNVIKNKMTENIEINTNKKLPKHSNIRGRDYYNN